MAKTIPTEIINLSARNGEFVTQKFAQSHRKTTEREHVPVSDPKK
jgi:hypothetical protein